MIVGGQTEARAQLSSTIIDYHGSFDQGFNIRSMIVHDSCRNRSSARSNGKKTMNYHEEFEQAQTE